MPRIATWDELPSAIRDHLVLRMRDRAIRTADLDQLRAWLRTEPAVPDGDWYKDFGSFKICGEGSYPKTFLIAGQAAKGKRL